MPGPPRQADSADARERRLLGAERSWRASPAIHADADIGEPIFASRSAFFGSSTFVRGERDADPSDVHSRQIKDMGLTRPPRPRSAETGCQRRGLRSYAALLRSKFADEAPDSRSGIGGCLQICRSLLRSRHDRSEPGRAPVC